MKPSTLWRAAATTILLCAVVTGCAYDRPEDRPAAVATSHGSIPLALRGENAVIRLSFPSGKQTVTPGQFQHDEICYLSAGEFRIDCFPDGSTLTLGPTDSTDLLTDLPGWNLAPVDPQDESGERFLRLSALLSLVAGSVDRLPSALADYVQNPGPHLAQALDLSEKLLTEESVELSGYARGGSFRVVVQLNDAGREKLETALDEVGEAPGGLQWVRLRTGRNAPLLPRPKNAAAAKSVNPSDHSP